VAPSGYHQVPSQAVTTRVIPLAGTTGRGTDAWRDWYFLGGSVTLLCDHSMKRHVLIFGLVGGLLIATLQYTEYRFVVIEHSVELYGMLVASLFSAFGIWLGLRITRGRETVRETVVVREVAVPVPAASAAGEPFAPNSVQRLALGITVRELEILTLVARGLSNREIAAQLFVSENTVKTHCSRAFDKLGAARRTQAVQRGKELGLLP
jgi:two-component system, NarL family, response regulator LiaR